MTPQEFIAKWGPGGPAYDLNERQGAQPHFMDLCQLLGVPTPGSEGDYSFEKDTLVLGEARGYADVFMRNHFAWENKAPGRNLDQALKQLLSYSLALSNPPLLVVCDRITLRIHTQFNGHPSETHVVLLQEMAQPEKQALLRRLWTDPQSFRPKKTSRDITEAAAQSFATLADGLRKRGPAKEMDPAGWQAHADEVAHFLTQCLFCFFAEDVGLLPERMFEGLVNNKAINSERLTKGLTNLFSVMSDGGLYGNDDIPWFNGGLFKAREEKAHLEAKTAREHLSEERIRLVRDVRLACLEEKTAFDAVALSEKILKQAKTGFDLALSRYSLGLSSIVELSQSQLNLTAAQLAFARAKYDCQAKRLMVEYQTGSLG